MADTKISDMTANTLLRSDSRVPFVIPGDAGNFRVNIDELLFRHRVQWSQASGSAIEHTNWTLSAGVSGVAQIVAPATSLLAGSARIRYTSAGNINSAASLRDDTTTSAYTGVYRNASGSALNGGFSTFFRIGFPTVRADQRILVGYRRASVAAWTTAEPSAFLDIIALAADEADTNIQIMHNDAAGTATKINLGITKASLAGKVLELTLYAPPAGATVYYDLYVVDDNARFAGNFNTNLPAADTLLGIIVAVNTGATTSTAVAHELLRVVQSTRF